MKYWFIVLVSISCHLHAQVLDTSSMKTNVDYSFSNPKKIHSYLVPAIFITYGAVSLGNNVVRELDLSTKSELSEDHPTFASQIDDYSKFLPVVALYGLDLVGLKSKNKVLDQTAMILITAGITDAVVSNLKKGIGRQRPDGSSYTSFPSGHTATAFAAAEFLHQEFKGRSPWIGYAGYAVAASTGILRLYNNKHWVSDIVAGAGVGMLSTKLTYLLYPYLKGMLGQHSANISITPSYNTGTFGIHLAYHFSD